MTIEYFVPDDRKSGGAYVTVTGVVKRISAADRIVTMESGELIPTDEITSLEI